MITSLQTIPIPKPSHEIHACDATLVPRARMPLEPGRMLGGFFSPGDDIARLTQRTTWFAGTVISLFAEHCVQAAQARERNVQHLSTMFMLHVGDLIAANEEDDHLKVPALLELIEQSLKKLKPPSQSETWLVPVHLSSHWTLLEIRWDLKQLRFYDSLPDRPKAMNDSATVQTRAQVLLQILRDYFHQPFIRSEEWIWIDEKVS
ncbi:hypothetical protein BOTBODRAFT_517345 [Botryobasidium botryosum FD-172 SS1]|uniref:Ubiquitin-like protease family profile domain-containing protein n=1 Tax=Botryobasidium botryosum (strain FD-172 SS1) TaxID=930990 RepID=A0A067MVB3_BOTB1|nr:hypothetical protein BOTBODRAFT_517345 [Botryobasidium botryosum FD-172 SS1]